jgi:predicted DNA-binding ArsR family transcriptional regulator
MRLLLLSSPEIAKRIARANAMMLVVSKNSSSDRFFIRGILQRKSTSIRDFLLEAETL